MHRLRSFVSMAVAAWHRTLPGGVVDRYSSRRGGLLANGLAYGLLFAFFAGLWTILSVAGLVVSGSQGVQRTVLSAMDSLVPGISGTVRSSGALAHISGTLTWTGIVTLASFVWSVIGWMDSLRSAVRSMFDEESDQIDTVHAKLRDLIGVVAIVILLMLSTTAGAISGGAVRAVLRFGGVPSNSMATSVLVDVVGFVVGFVFNTLLLIIALRVVAHVRRGRSTIGGAMLGGFAYSVMQLLGARLLGGASGNPLLAPFAAIIGVLLWFNLMTQVMLYCSALIAEVRERYRGTRHA